MHKKWVWTALLSLPLAVVGGLVYAKSLAQAGDGGRQVEAAGYTCPITGEELPCPDCCPLNQEK